MTARSLHRAAVLLALAAAACSEEDANPRVLWLDLDGSEIKVRLVEREPVPF
ncbi:MAG: hypothetical protein R3B48_06000 [Kofleriaceae bacterium]